MNGFGSAFRSTYMQTAVGEVDRIPPQPHELGHAKAVPIGGQHHGRIPVAVAVAAGGGDQAVNLGVGQVLARPDLAVAPAKWRPTGDCPINDGWSDQRQMLFCHGFSGLSSYYCPDYGPSRDTAQGE